MAGNSVLIVGEITGGQLSPITGELVAAAAPMAQALGGEVVAALGGSQVGSLGEEAAALGAHKVYVTEHPLLEEYFHVDAHLAVVEGVAKAVDPSVILMGRTLLGRDVGPRLAFRLGAGLAQDCVRLSTRYRERRPDGRAASLRRGLPGPRGGGNVAPGGDGAAEDLRPCRAGRVAPR